MWDLNEALRKLLPKEAVAALDRGDMLKFEEITRKAMENNTGLRWAVTQGIWTFGVSSLTEFMSKSKQYTMRGIAGQIQCPCLVMEAETDLFFQGQPQEIYEALQAPKQLVRFTSEDGADNHCQSGALAYKDQVVFDWLDETMNLHDGRKG